MYINADSFGADLPDNWETIANKLNSAIDAMATDDMTDDELHDLANDIWDKYWSGCLYWYAVMMDADDTDWGSGSYDLEEAKQMVRSNRNIYPNGYIAVIQEGSDPVCVDEIRDI